jgi:hypothetical protein
MAISFGIATKAVANMTKASVIVALERFANRITGRGSGSIPARMARRAMMVIACGDSGNHEDCPYQ